MRLNRQDIAQTLAAIANEVNSKIPLVNHGGCGVYAVELAKRLAKLGIEDFKLRCYGYEDAGCININTIEQHAFNSRLPYRCRDWNSQRVYFCHVRLEWNDRMWDVEGDISISQVYGMFRLYDGYISLPALEKLTRNSYNWNSMYDRSMTRKMRAIMDRHLRPLFNKYGASS